MTTLTEPLTIDQIRAQAGDDNIVTGLIPFDLSDLIDNDLEAVLDLMSERLVGSCLGMQIDGTPVRVEDGNIILLVSLDASMILDEADADV